MPSRNIVKIYAPNTYYHIYNRGVEKRKIFLDEQDCHVFLRYIKLYLSSVESIKNQSLAGLVKLRFTNLNLSEEVELITFALMPNHIHLLIKQTTLNGIVKFMRRLTTGYVMYFNKKYKRTGPLFQGKYKGIIVPNDEYLLHLSRYIHLNPANLKSSFDFMQYSSFPYYLGEKSAEWLKTNTLLEYFRNSKDPKSKYVEFVRSNINNLAQDYILDR